MDENGKLLEGENIPFSLEEGVKLYKLMVQSAEYDKFLLTLQRQGRISFYLTAHGEEATSVGTAAALQPQDHIWPQYRELGMFLYRGLTLDEMVANCIGNEDDRSKGRNLQAHYSLIEKNVEIVTSPLATQISQAPGCGYVFSLEKKDRVSVCYFGDGAASEGDALVALNFAAVTKAQTIFICRNNGFAISTPVKEQYAGDGIAARGPAFGVTSVRVDGNDIVAVFKAMQEARRLCVENQQPVILELMTYRLGDHTTSDDSKAYRAKEEIESWRPKGPIPRFGAYLTSQGVWSEEQQAELVSQSRADIVAAFKRGETRKRGALKELFEDIYTDLPWHLEEQWQRTERHVRAYSSDYNVGNYRGLDGPLPPMDPSRIASGPRERPPPPSSTTQRMTMVNAINEAMSIAMERNEKTILLGEDVGFGGVFRCSVGLRDKFGAQRVMNTPLCEQGIAAFAVGLSVQGYTAIAEMQFADYIFPAFDQIVNEIAKFRYRNAHGGCGNIVIRAPCSAVGHGSMYHSQSVEAYFAHCPGLKIVMPRGPKQAKGLFLAALRDPNPVMFFEPKVLYRHVFEDADGDVPEGYYEFPLGEAEVVQQGTDVTLLGWGSQMQRLHKAAERAAAEGVSCEIIDLQTIVPWDIDTVEASVKKTGRLIVTHEAPSTCGFGAEIVSKIQERCFLHLEAPIQRVTGHDTHFPYAWEEFYVPSAARVHEAIMTAVKF
jgi:pyruvate/2-oxoglutarate/acetoin dehydrogenase E1 component/TPP-dependent pyruvate/acetoin dehydrogenase alpha subunit